MPISSRLKEEFDEQKSINNSFEAFNRLWELYPESQDNEIRGTRNIIGMVYNGLEEWDKAVEQFEWLIQNKYEGYQPYVNITTPYMAKGLYDKAIEVIEYYHKNFKELPITRWDLANNYLCQGKYDLALAEADKSLSLDPALYRNFFTKGDIHLLRSDLAQAEKEYQNLLASKEQPAHFYYREKSGAVYLSKGQFKRAEDQLKQGIESIKDLGDLLWKAQFNQQLGYIHLKSGNYKEALKEYDELWKFGVGRGRSSRQIYALFFKGLIFLETNSIEQAQIAADEIKVLVEQGFRKKHIRFYLHLMGEIELKRENFSKAIEYFNEALSYIPYETPREEDQALFINSLASAYNLSGEKEKAIEQYERILTLTTGRVYYGDIYARAFYMLGKIFEEKGLKGKAIENYEKFLDLWRDADPGIAEVEDAKRRLTEMRK